MSIHSTAQIHPSSVVADTSVIGARCVVGPFCTIGADVEIAEDCELVSHVVVDGHTRLGSGNKVFPFAAIGVPPQDLKYRGEPTQLEIGERNVIRESVTISRGTAGGGGVTRIGSDCLVMAYAHIGHDSQVGSHCILANGATLAGHVAIEDFATVGALCAVHQFCRIGRYSFVGGGTIIIQDVLPFSLTSAKRDAHAFGLNRVGLQRRGFSAEQMRDLHRAYKTLCGAKLNTKQAVEKLRAEEVSSEEVRYLIEFIESSTRGVLK
ncbi:MAG TPA: acyl-ACP--UDP-N-acetylglucosamine O-acyltransferase [Acidobacteriaceae bacterium]|nr:acyl-ACP--UDP-N-acetylglucosamine O-acyltransferase [Acidobacteriaceae bacterium]